MASKAMATARRQCPECPWAVAATFSTTALATATVVAAMAQHTRECPVVRARLRNEQVLELALARRATLLQDDFGYLGAVE